jgi:basic amino acid/polyamine antiporter, APA family
VLAQRRTPWVSALFVFGLSIVLLPLSDLRMLAELSSISALLAFIAVNATLIALRFREPDAARPFRVPGAIGRVPVLPVLAILSILFLLAFFEAEVYWGAALAIAVTSAAYLARRWWK